MGFTYLLRKRHVRNLFLPNDKQNVKRKKKLGNLRKFIIDGRWYYLLVFGSVVKKVQINNFLMAHYDMTENIRKKTRKKIEVRVLGNKN